MPHTATDRIQRIIEARQHCEQLAATLVGLFAGPAGRGAGASLALELDHSTSVAIVVAACVRLVGGGGIGAAHHRFLSPRRADVEHSATSGPHRAAERHDDTGLVDAGSNQSVGRASGVAVGGRVDRRLGEHGAA